MATADMKLLEDITRELASFQSGVISVGEVSRRLLNLRDRLAFEDPAWYRELTDHVVTLDSASTFVPSSDAEEQQVRTAVSAAVGQIRHLIEAKAVQLL